MPSFQDDAIVLRKFDYSETSQILALMTRGHGKVRAIAKGIRRGTKNRFAVGVDLLDVGQAVLSGRSDRSENLTLLTEWKPRLGFHGLRDGLPRLYAALYVAEIVDALTEVWDVHDGLFDEVFRTLINLGRSIEPLAELVDFLPAFLKSLGSLPRWDACVLCGRSGDLTHFSSHEGGLVCRHCEGRRAEKMELSPETIGRLRGVPQSDHPASPIGPFVILHYHVSHLMGRESLLVNYLVSPRDRRSVH